MSDVINEIGRAVEDSAPVDVLSDAVRSFDVREDAPTLCPDKPSLPEPSALDAHAAAGHQLIPLDGKVPTERAWTKAKPLDVANAKARMQAGKNVGVRLRATDLVVDVDPRNFDDGDDPLARLLEQTDGARGHYQSPVQMLMREGLGSERRSRLLQQIAHSGPVELASLAEFAAATEDKELGAALCTRVSDLAPNERPFSSHELADALVGEEHRRVTAALMEVDRLTQEAAHADSAFERGAANPVRSIRIARMKQAEAAVGADLANLDDTEDEEE